MGGNPPDIGLEILQLHIIEMVSYFFFKFACLVLPVLGMSCSSTLQNFSIKR